MKNLFKLTIFLLLLSKQASLEGVYLISLGGDCSVASVLRYLGLRKAAFPFDWMFASFNAVYNAIEDDFEHFLDPATLKISADPRIIIDSYGFGFVHDFPTIHHSAALSDSVTHDWAQIRDDWRDFIQPIRAKYFRRIERFRNALSGSEHVFLIRYTLTDRGEAIKLRDLLSARYPYSKFTIVAVSGSAADNTDWHLEKIRNFFVIYNAPDSYTRWKNIFTSLGINPSEVKTEFNCEEDEDCGCDGSCKSFQLSDML